MTLYNANSWPLEGGSISLAPHRLVHQSSWDAPFGSVWVIAVGGTGDSWGSVCGPCITPTPGREPPGSGSPSACDPISCTVRLIPNGLPNLCQDVRLEGVRQAVPTGHDLGQVLGKPVLFWYSSWVWESVLLVSRCVGLCCGCSSCEAPTLLCCKGFAVDLFGFCVGCVRDSGRRAVGKLARGSSD